MRYICLRIRETEWTPSYREIARHLGITGVYSHILALEKRGYIRRGADTPDGCIVVTPKWEAYEKIVADRSKIEQELAVDRMAEVDDSVTGRYAAKVGGMPAGAVVTLRCYFCDLVAIGLARIEMPVTGIGTKPDAVVRGVCAEHSGLPMMPAPPPTDGG